MISDKLEKQSFKIIKQIDVEEFTCQVFQDEANNLDGFILEPKNKANPSDLRLLKTCNFQTIITKLNMKLENENPSKRFALFILFTNDQKYESIDEQLYMKMTKSGLKFYVRNLASKNIRTNLDIVYIERDRNVKKEIIFQFIKQLAKEQSTAVIHGSEIVFNQYDVENFSTNQSKTNGFFTLITGGSRGIGKCAAELMAREGRNLVITGRPGNKQITQFAIYLSQKYQVQVQSFYLDIKQQQSCDQLGEKIKKLNIKFDAVVFNAGVGTKTSYQQAEQNLTHSDVLFEVNSIGPIRLLKCLQKLELVNKATAIMIVSSVAGGLRGFKQFSDPDLCSKHVLEQWMLNLFTKYNEVMCIYPGGTDTNMFQKSTTNRLKQLNKLQEFIDSLAKKILIKPETIAHLITLMTHKKYRHHLNKCKLAACCGSHLDFQSLYTI